MVITTHTNKQKAIDENKLKYHIKYIVYILQLIQFISIDFTIRSDYKYFIK